MSGDSFRRALICAATLLLLAAPVLAQAPDPPTAVDPRAFLPADVDAWLRLDLDDRDALDALNIAARSAALLQPARPGLQALQGLEQALPLQQLDTEALPVFARDFAPWLDDELFLAWRQDADSPAPLLILPTQDLLQALGSFSDILDEQDLLQRDQHQGQRLWLADRSSIAFTPGAVLIGPETLVRAALDAQAGAGPALLAEGSGMTPRDGEGTASGEILSGWLRGAQTPQALAALLSGSEEAEPLLDAFAQALEGLGGDPTLPQLALGGDVRALTFSLETDRPRLNVLRLSLTLHGDDDVAAPAPAPFNSAVLEPVPRSAMLVASGSDARQLAYNLLAALPFSAFGGELLGPFGVRQSQGAASGLLTAPDADTINTLVNGWLMALWDQANFDLDLDLLRRLDGSFSLALLPRPNDPLPPLNMPWDLLLVAEVDDGQAVIDALDRLFSLTLDARGLAGDAAEGSLRRTLPGDDLVETPLQVWLEDGLLLLGTGSAPEAMERALRGDDRLIDRARWQTLAQDRPPQLYVDIAPLYATFLPAASGPQLQQLRQLGLRSDSPATGRHQLDITLTLPDVIS
ncbi:MAG: DUF3352 domain-containing protein [Anaerolineaceae bacterium]|nr:DUF3352 domain-containing protein [Anaerolineaceae bacterium]MDE0327756.1 DUF3352 domain-containing protein [Anaerolineaceae bacterium]